MGEKVTLTTLRKKYETKIPLVYLTAYDYATGRLVDRAGVDVCLVGDSLSMVALGRPDTTSLTMDVKSPPFFKLMLKEA